MIVLSAVRYREILLAILDYVIVTAKVDVQEPRMSIETWTPTFLTFQSALYLLPQHC